MSCCELFQAFFRTTNQTVIPSAYEPPENRRQTAEYTIPNHDPRGVYSFNFFSQPRAFPVTQKPTIPFYFPLQPHREASERSIDQVAAAGGPIRARWSMEEIDGQGPSKCAVRGATNYS